MPGKRTVIRIILLLLCFDAIATILIDFGGRTTILRFLPDVAHGEATDLFLASQLQIAGFRIGLVVMWWLAIREPAKNRAVLIGTGVGLIGLGISEVLAPQLLSMQPLYPSWMVWTHTIVRCTFGATLFFLSV